MLKDQLSKLKNLFQSRKIAYLHTFNNGNASHAVLVDLARFCRAQESTFVADDRTMLMLEGRREVWLRIQNYLNLSSDELFELHQIRNKGD